MDEEKSVFAASRLTSGNFVFPSRIEVSKERVSRIKPGLFKSEEESIAISKVASVTINSGWIWSEIRIDSAGGANPIVSHGHPKQDALRIREIIERHQG
jgi:hypothetical protein